jgi:hypothetical protein
VATRLVTLLGARVVTLPGGLLETLLGARVVTLPGGLLVTLLGGLLATLGVLAGALLAALGGASPRISLPLTGSSKYTPPSTTSSTVTSFAPGPASRWAIREDNSGDCTE